MLVRTPAGKYDFIDFRETAPAGSSENMYANHTELSISGGLASAIPGELRGLEEIHKLYGSLPWHTLVWPSIKLARHGFIVGQDLAVYVGDAASYPFLDSDPAWALDFAPDGVRVKAGERMYRRRYADTLEAVAKRGVDAFYHGPIANATVQTLRRTGGIMTLEDLAKYEVLHRAPATLKYKGFKLTGCSAPSGGTVVGSTLNIFSGFKADFKGDAAGLTTHRLVEAMKYAYGQVGFCVWERRGTIADSSCREGNSVIRCLCLEWMSTRRACSVPQPPQRSAASSVIPASTTSRHTIQRV